MGIQFIWDEKYCIGNELVDRQHKRMFELANSIDREINEAAAQTIVMELYKYTREHFADEERMMQEVG